MSTRYPASWWTTRWGDLAIRAIGMAALGLGGLAIDLVAALVRAGAGQAASTLGLAAIGFMSGSLGAAAFMVGRGLLERVERSAAWRTSEPPPPLPTLQRREGDQHGFPRMAEGKCGV
ncbi:hypothetical protein [Sphingomonas colocasiae]|uniref:Uncharacterized protein n=1 Tax=Sphingomonas colocasiae TaxID=1848973 RepID=A0ABS7PUF4_9SPHN|nr:hypothetical protein [Sphingomonas colocasiae]MBY8824978.1 hypothetical protein [Sphingomonas colocasiae]